MNCKIKELKLVIAGAGTWIGGLLGTMWHVLFLLVVLMLVDYLSGMLAAKKEAMDHPEQPQCGWSSRKSVIGIYKKVGYILTILVAISTDYIFFYYSGKMGWDMPARTTFGLLITIWFIINELLSILENVGRMGVMLPEFLCKVLKELKRDAEEKDSQWKGKV